MEAILARALNGEHLDFEETRQVIAAIMAGQLEPAAIAGFLVALKVRGETAAEIGGAARALQDAALPVTSSRRPLLDTCGTGGDGLNTFNVSTAAAVVIAAGGVAVAKHGNRAVSSKAGSADVLEALGVKIELQPASSVRLLDELGIAFLFAPLHHPAMRHVMPVRRVLATRTLFNLIGPLSNPARPTAQVLGVFLPELLEPMAQALLDLGLECALVVHGSGMDEICLHGTTEAVALERGALRRLTLDPSAYGIEAAEPDALRGGDTEANARLVRDVLGGKDRGARARCVALNAAAGLMLAEKAVDWPEAYGLALDLLTSGEPARLLERWAEASQDLD